MSPQDNENNPFDKLAARYDGWFDSAQGRNIFAIELQCLRDLFEQAPHPWLEVGVGTGRFAQALGVEDGIDPSSEVLRMAAGRGVRTMVGAGEHLPYAAATYGTVLLVVTICFLTDPARALQECARVLRPDGSLIIGLVPADSAWGISYAAKGKEGHPFYSVARFYTSEQVLGMAQAAGFHFARARSCLFEPPETAVAARARPQEGIVANAGFVALRFQLAKPRARSHGKGPPKLV